MTMPSDDAITVEVPVTQPETVDETPVEVTVETPVTVEVPEVSAPTGDAVQAELMSQLAEMRERLVERDNQISELQSRLDGVQATAESTAEIIATADELESSELESMQEVIGEIQEDLAPPDIAPMNSHPWFRTKGEWADRHRG